MIRAVKGSSEKIEHMLGRGLQIFFHYDDSLLCNPAVYLEAYLPGLQVPVAVEALIWISAIIRIAVCMLPQNHWCTEEGNMRLSVIRNGVFAITGIGVIILYAISGNAGGYHMTRMVAAILISFGCYLPGYVFQQEEADGRNFDDSKDLRLYVDHYYGFAASAN